MRNPVAVATNHLGNVLTTISDRKFGIDTDNNNVINQYSLIGHSHGGNVAILAFNRLAEFGALKDKKFNLLTINTPVRPDYQLSANASKRVNHYHIFDPADPVAIRGGHDPKQFCWRGHLVRDYYFQTSMFEM